MIGSIVGLLRRKYRERQALEELSRLSDATLRDIGLTRSNLHSAVRGRIRDL